jgi:hypothetical protein
MVVGLLPVTRHHPAADELRRLVDDEHPAVARLLASIAMRRHMF